MSESTHGYRCPPIGGHFTDALTGGADTRAAVRSDDSAATDPGVLRALARLHAELAQWRRVREDSVALHQHFAPSADAIMAVIAEVDRHHARVDAAIAALGAARREATA